MFGFIFPLYLYITDQVLGERVHLQSFLILTFHNSNIQEGSFLLKHVQEESLTCSQDAAFCLYTSIIPYLTVGNPGVQRLIQDQRINSKYSRKKLL
jgi:hypothetical protein